ncbi:MAG: hypothetical protein V7K40_32650 [Nostoc sp.]|uniref:hypothetical protein n=1 Tax=Nostoc sp. TaxID=1180 RepID=UPI002FF8C72F
MNTDPLLAEAPELNHQLSPANMKRAKLEEFRQAVYKHQRRIRYPIVKKSTTKPRKEPPKSA